MGSLLGTRKPLACEKKGRALDETLPVLPTNKVDGDETLPIGPVCKAAGEQKQSLHHSDTGTVDEKIPVRHIDKGKQPVLHVDKGKQPILHVDNSAVKQRRSDDHLAPSLWV